MPHVLKKSEKHQRPVAKPLDHRWEEVQLWRALEAWASQSAVLIVIPSLVRPQRVSPVRHRGSPAKVSPLLFWDNCESWEGVSSLAPMTAWIEVDDHEVYGGTTAVTKDRTPSCKQPTRFKEVVTERWWIENVVGSALRPFAVRALGSVA